MPQKICFLVMPYLMTSKPVEIRGVRFRNSNDTEGLSPKNVSSLETIFAMFFLHGELRIREMVYATLEYDPNDDQSLAEAQRKWSESCLLIEYLYTHPHASWRSVPACVENASMYLFVERNISTSYYASNQLVNNIGESMIPSSENVLHGYAVTLIRRNDARFTVVEGGRIYPPDHFIQLNILLRDLFRAVSGISLDKTKWALSELFTNQSRPVTPTERRALHAIRWFSDSCRSSFFADQSLLLLAVAFETLLNIDPGNKDRVTERLRVTIKAIVGGFPRIDSWVEQFYDARSRVVHEGGSADFLFYATDQGKSSGKAKEKPGAIPYRSLSEYGRTIFHLCVDTLLSGSRMAEEVGLQQSLIHNHERLDSIFQALNEKGRRTADQASAATRDALDLRRNWSGFDEFVDRNKLLGALKRSIEFYNDESPNQTWALLPDVERYVRVIFDELNARNEANSFRKIIELDEKLHESAWYDYGFGIKGDDPACLVLALVSYAATVAPSEIRRARNTPSEQMTGELGSQRENDEG